jgi:uncharacterized iron-regulated membrane protein
MSSGIRFRQYWCGSGGFARLAGGTTLFWRRQSALFSVRPKTAFRYFWTKSRTVFRERDLVSG